MTRFLPTNYLEKQIALSVQLIIATIEADALNSGGMLFMELGMAGLKLEG